MMKLHPKQKYSITDSTARLNVWEGAVRSGKSIAIDFRFIKAVGEPNVSSSPDAVDVMIGKTLSSLKRNVIGPIIDLVGQDNAFYFPGKQEFHLWDRIIYTIGANDERSEGKIRGATIRKCMGDELTLWPESFFKMMDSRLSLEESQFFGSTNPGPPRHYLKVDYLDRESELNLKRYSFKIPDNPSLPASYVEAIKKNYTGLWYKRFILGEWCMAEGAIYDFFDEDLHTRTEDKFPEVLERTVGVDYGTSNPTVFVVMAHNYMSKPKVWAEDEYFHDSIKAKRQKTDEEYADDFVAFVKGREHLTKVFIDPTAASFKLSLKRALMKAGIFMSIVDADNDVTNGIRTQATMLKSGDYALSKRCKRVIEDYFSYIWDPKAQIRGLDEPVKSGGTDHTKDAERYALHSQFGDSTFIDYNAFLKG